jgi:hypothetical protein
MDDPDLSEFEAHDRVAELQRLNATLQVQLKRAKAKTEDLVEATHQGARDALLALGPIPPVPAPKADRRTRGAEVALWHLTDFQGGKITPEYNSDVMTDRVLRYVDKARRLTEIHRSDHPVKDCTIMFGGDLIEGLMNFPQQPFEVDATIFDQWARAARLAAEVVRRALSIYEHVTVIGEWGNHGRIGSKRDSIPRADNIDRMVYELARTILEPEIGGRLTWQDCPTGVQHVQIGNYRAVLIHGDEFGRNGFVSRSTMVKKVNDWKAGAWDWQFQDAYVGHYHVHGEEGLADGRSSVYWTGSTESGSTYAKENIAAGSHPSQRLHFVDPRAAMVTSQHRIWLAA